MSGDNEVNQSVGKKTSRVWWWVGGTLVVFYIIGSQEEAKVSKAATQAERNGTPEQVASSRQKVEKQVSDSPSQTSALTREQIMANREKLTCPVRLPNGKLVTYRLALRSNAEAVLVEPAANPNGTPLDRLSYAYPGVWTVTAGGILVEFDGMVAVPNDDEAAYLVNANNLNDGRLGGNIIEHTITLDDRKVPWSGVYTHTTAKSGPRRMNIHCS